MKKLSLLICGLLAAGAMLAGTIGGMMVDADIISRTPEQERQSKLQFFHFTRKITFKL